MFVTFFDTCMVSLAAVVVWRLSPFLVMLPWLTIALMDGAYLSSALTKVPQGAWFTITLAAILASILLLWRYGKEQQWFAEAEDRFPTSHYVTTRSDGRLILSERFDGTPVSVTRGFGIFFDKAGETTPLVFSQFLLKLTAMPEVSVFFHLRPLETPSVAPENRHSVSRLGIPYCYRLVVRYGYNDEIITPNLASVVAEQIRRHLLADLPLDAQVEDQDHLTEETATANPTPSDTAAETPSDPNEKGSKDEDGDTDTTNEKRTRFAKKLRVETELAKLEEAYAHKVLYIIGKEQMKIKEKTNWIRKGVLAIFLWIRENTRNKMANLRVPTDRVIEVGFLKEI